MECREAGGPDASIMGLDSQQKRRRWD